MEAVKVGAYSIAVDESNDTGLDKMNPMTVRIYEPSSGRIITRFFLVLA